MSLFIGFFVELRTLSKSLIGTETDVQYRKEGESQSQTRGKWP